MTKQSIAVLTYIVLAILLVPAYWYGREVMTWFAPYIVTYVSNITLNFLLLFFFYGVACDRMTRKMSRRKGWIIWLVGLVVLMVFFRFFWWV